MASAKRISVSGLASQLLLENEASATWPWQEAPVQEVSPFDLQRMFLGDNFSTLLLLEVAFRTAFMYVVALILVRFIGKRGLGQLSPFEYLVVIAMGSAAGDPMFYPDVPLVHGVLVLSAIVLLQKSLIAVSGKSHSINNFVESTPTMLIKDGTVLRNKVTQEGLALDELLMKLREAGITHVGQIEFAYLEPSGSLSVFRYGREGPRRGESTLPDDAVR